jgi:hypothetical protein
MGHWKGDFAVSAVRGIMSKISEESELLKAVLQELRDKLLLLSKEHRRSADNCGSVTYSAIWHAAKAETYQRCADKVQEIIDAN